jgi:hypothetical protein
VDEPGPAVASWSTKPAAVAAAGGGAVVFLALALLSGDAAGRLLLGLAVLGLAVATVLGARLRPRLSVDVHGLTVRGVTGTLRLTWSEVEQVEVVRTRRLGREVPVLEISPRDTEQRVGALVVLTRLDLGAEPQDVHDRLLAVRMGHP